MTRTFTLAALLLVGSALSADNTPQAADLFETLDVNGDGTLDSSEIGEQQRKAFERLLRVGDADEDGKLTKEEYLSGFQPEAPVQIGPPGRGPTGPRGGQPQRQDIDRLFETADRDKDGKIALDDLPERMQQRLQPLFKRLGKDELTRADFEQPGRMFGARPGQEGLQMQPGDGDRPQMALVKLLDTDGNGLLSKAELDKLAEKFSVLDRNGDGQLGPGELIGFGDRPMMREGRRPLIRPDGVRPKGDSPQSRRPRRPDGDQPSSPEDSGRQPDAK